MYKTLFSLSALLGSSIAFAGGGDPASDPIADHNNAWVGQALTRQRQLNNFAPISTNSILGSHNSYNSRAYRDADSYLDPQQHHSVYDQLRLGARFLELDAHWTYKIDGFNWGNDILLCHSGIGRNIGDVHVGCSLTDKYLAEVMVEIRNWLNENPSEVIILYTEDHTDGRHQELANIVMGHVGNKIYSSNGCGDIPASLTKADVLLAGKQVVWFFDGGCSGTTALKNNAFTGLGAISRIWEDHTTVGSLAGKSVYLSTEDIANEFRNGRNLVNLDDLTHDDGRTAGAVWSWDVNQPDDHNGGQDCALQWWNGRWDDAGCGEHRPFACYKATSNEWKITNARNEWHHGAATCASEFPGFVYSVPTNSQSNEALNQVRQQTGNGHVWLNYNDKAREGDWRLGNEARNGYADVEFKYGANRHLSARWNGNFCINTDLNRPSQNGVNLNLHECHQVTEKWNLLKNGHIQAAWNPAYCLDVHGINATTNGANIGLHQCDQVSETWEMTSDHKIRAKWNPNFCLDVAGTNAQHNGANIGLWQCDQVTETWTFK